MSKTITVRVDENTKECASKVLKEVGLDMSTAVNMFLRQVIITNGIPFNISAEKPNKVTLNAFNELDNGGGKSFSSVDALMEDLNG
ncbi:type II toxin-antitoxin system RelB/DinJ family antitoxin [Butyrivibrio proteoclasticus]|uniref:type II toxin-antitoxin system RelB/DinJ family antitoxin n=1 Tax=Butyrivibrio proteoclasticus TaxID=43305 RepID=UPI000554B9DA|nr:type II toxin-antitoxin system RelB/DinJ family antitoxin [Butyrivibrio proteoclasticus]